MNKLNLSLIPASVDFVLRWSDMPGGKIIVTAYKDEQDKDGKLVGEQLATMTFDISEASEANTKRAALYGFKKKLQDDAAQIVPGKGYTLRDKLESFEKTWEVMQSENWAAKREGRKSAGIDLYRLAGAIALGNGKPLETAFAIQMKLQTKTKEELAAMAASDAASRGFVLFDKMMAEVDDISLD